MSKTGTLRRVPRQARARRRIDVILDAAAAEFAEVGFETTTTNAIARRAGTSIGSLYQFFPNKEAILEALASHYETQLRALHDAILNEETASLPMPEIYDRVIQGLADFHATHPGFRPLFYGSATAGRLAAAADRLRQECINRVDAMIPPPPRPGTPPPAPLCDDERGCRQGAFAAVGIRRRRLPQTGAGRNQVSAAGPHARSSGARGSTTKDTKDAKIGERAMLWRFARRGSLWLCLVVALLSPAAVRAAEPAAK